MVVLKKKRFLMLICIVLLICCAPHNLLLFYLISFRQGGAIYHSANGMAPHLLRTLRDEYHTTSCPSKTVLRGGNAAMVSATRLANVQCGRRLSASHTCSTLSTPRTVALRRSGLPPPSRALAGSADVPQDGSRHLCVSI